MGFAPEGSTLDAMAQPPGGIRLVEVRIRNFRCLRVIDVSLDRVTVLIGENNAGKTSFLDALFLAIGAGPRACPEDDVYLGSGEPAAPRDRRVTVDLLIRPTDASGNVIAKFPAGSPWLSLWGEGVTQNDDDHDIVVIRTQVKWDGIKGEYEPTRAFLRDWPASLDDAHLASTKSILRPVRNDQLEPLALYLLDAKRDIATDLRNRSSFWSKLVSDPGLSPDTVKDIEATLSTVNDLIVSGSTVLSHLQSHLAVLSDSLPGIATGVTITPVSRHLRDLTKGMDVLLSGTDTATLPLSRQGMGTRSVATLLTFRAYADWKQAHAKGAAVHSLLAIEEPEAHLHPHAQRALFKQFQALPGQCIISTHSPYIASQASILTFRHFRRQGGLTTARQLLQGPLTEEDLRKIDRQVINTRGDMLFASAVILVSGETEEQSLPAFADAFFGRSAHELGLSVIGVGGDGNYLPFLRLADCFGISWFIFSDGEPKAIKHLNAALNSITQPCVGANPRVIAIDKDRDFETYLADEYNDTLVSMVIAMNAKTSEHRTALVAEWANKTRHDLIQELQRTKTRYGRPCADAITALPDQDRRYPSLIHDLLTAVRRDL
jgi:putative ATP-dependent endonuclease of OLD family